MAVAVGAAAVEAALEGACVRGRRAHALGRGAVAVGGRRAPPQRLGRRRRAGRRRAVVVVVAVAVAVAVEPAFLRPGVDVVGRHQHRREKLTADRQERGERKPNEVCRTS